jgi:hypothetical protein
MSRWLLLSTYHWTVLLGLLGASAALVAWISFGLINLAMANIDFLTRHGLLALREGGLLQLLEISAKACVALAAYLTFKAIETELIHRWREAGR